MHLLLKTKRQADENCPPAMLHQFLKMERLGASLPHSVQMWMPRLLSVPHVGQRQVVLSGLISIICSRRAFKRSIAKEKTIIKMPTTMTNP